MTIEFINTNHPLFPSVVELGRKNAATLGHMPDGGFDDYAKQNNLIIAYEGNELFGYLMYRFVKRYNRLTIVHLCVEYKYRGKNIPIALLDALRERYDNCGISGILLSCRSDYTFASSLWEKYGFVAINRKRSRSIKENYLTVWWYDFHQPDLFSAGFNKGTRVRAMLDTNIVLELRTLDTQTKVEVDPRSDPRCLMADWLIEETDYCFSPEIYNEINRDDDKERVRDTRTFLTSFSEAQFNIEEQKEIAAELERIIVGDSDNDKSDRKQVASCIASRIPYFITYDEGLLKTKGKIESCFDIQLFTPQVFVMAVDQLLHSEEYLPVLLKGVAFQSLSKTNSSEINNLLATFLRNDKGEKKKDFQNIVSSVLNSLSGELYTVSSHSKNIAFYGLISQGDSTSIQFIRIYDNPLSCSLLFQVVSDTLRRCIEQRRVCLFIKERFLTSEQERVLLNFGFLPKDDGNLVKLICNRIIHRSEVPDLLNMAGLDSKSIPLYSDTLIETEKLFFPLKIREIEIPTYIIPIRSYWAGQLFDYSISEEDLFGADPIKLWSPENVYFRHTRPITEVSPSRVLWYVSGYDRTYVRSKSIVATSYITDVYTGKPKDLFKRFRHYGIYEWRNIYELCHRDTNENIRAIKFSHTELFSTPIAYDSIQQVLSNHGFKQNTFASPLKVSSDVFFAIYSMGKQIDSK